MNVPKLRFREFSGEWILISLGEISEKVTSGSRDWAQYYSETGSKFIRMTNLSRGGIQLKLDDLKLVDVNSESLDGQRTSLICGDILISITAELGKIGWIPPNFGDAFINQHTALVRLKKTIADSRCVAYVLSTTKLNQQINKLNDSGAKAGLNLPTVRSITFFLPKLEEQTKIANFLAAVDEKIEQLIQQVSLLQRYKKGAMQQIFSQQLRFKDDDGNDFPEWEEKSLGDVSFKKSSSISANSLDENVGTYKIYGAAGVLKYVDFFTEDEPYISIVKDGAGVGRTFLCDKNTSVLGTLDIIKAKAHINLLYIHAVIQQIDFTIYITGSTIPHIYFKDYSKENIMLPIFEEQTKIANFLSAIDDKITNAQQQLDATKQYKTSLLQQMFI